MTKQLIIFDCDGVLIDSEALSAQVLAEMLSEHGHSMTAEQVMHRFVGNTDSRVAEIVSNETGLVLPDDFAIQVSARAIAAFEQNLHAVPGADAVLRDLTRPICVASNSGIERLERALTIAGLRHYFAENAVFSAAMVARGKPAPDLHRHTAACMGARPADCIVIEDSVTGVQAAKAAGMAVIGFTGAGHGIEDHTAQLRQAGAGAVVQTMPELPALLATF